MNTQHDITVSGKPLNPPKPPAKPHMLLWIDTETTGLDPNQCELLEVGMQVTDLKAETRGGSLHLIVHPDNVRNWANHPEMLKAYEMHLANGQGTVNNPDPGYVRWYELPDGSAAVRCFSDSGGASCDWGHIELRDKQ